MGLVRALQPWDLLLTYCNKQLRNYIAPLLRTVRRGILHPPSDVYVRSFLCPISYFNKTLLQKSSWVIKPGPWFQSYIFFFGDHESNVVHHKLSFLCTITRHFQPLLTLCFPLCPEISCLFTLLIHSRPFGVLFCFQNKYLKLGVKRAHLTLFSMVKDWKLFLWDWEEGKDVHTASLFNKGLKPLTRAIRQEKEITASQSEKLESYLLPYRTRSFVYKL